MLFLNLYLNCSNLLSSSMASYFQKDIPSPIPSQLWDQFSCSYFYFLQKINPQKWIKVTLNPVNCKRWPIYHIKLQFCIYTTLQGLCLLQTSRKWCWKKPCNSQQFAVIYVSSRPSHTYGNLWIFLQLIIKRNLAFRDASCALTCSWFVYDWLYYPIMTFLYFYGKANEILIIIDNLLVV